MAVTGGSGTRAWVEQVEKSLDKASVPSVAASRRSIYRVPACIKDGDPNRKVYKPRVVSLGPFHHGDPELAPMEEHKQRALRHLLRRANQRPRLLPELVASVEEVAEELESAYYPDLGDWWRGEEGRERFLEMMVVDGCFLLEVMRAADLHAKIAGDDYAPDDPVFSHHGVVYMVPYIRRDMLMLENQVPLLLLQKLVAVETAKPPNSDVINRMVLRFMSPSPRPPPSDTLGLHALDLHRRNMLYGYHPAPPHWSSSRDEPGPDDIIIIRSALELYEAGIRFKKSRSKASLHDIRFRHGVLSMPSLTVDDSTEYMLANTMAFERLHVGAGNDVTAYVFFMGGIVKLAKDVAVLSSSGIIQNAAGSDEAAAKMFASVSKDMVLEPERALEAVQREVNAYCEKPWNKWRANVIHNYFRSPTSVLNFLAAAVALVMIVVQTAYTIMAFYYN
ncbi:unnamed protein product [Urochloa decumbens]|uniref:Uncharacterized protein n=1 Tax=Urochloa decumbens TaxID=240449 RepID=A0ABC9ALE7_9POAL